MRLFSIFVFLVWSFCICSSKNHHNARVTIRHQEMSQLPLESTEGGFVKFVSKNGSKIIWMARKEKLYLIDSTQDIKPKLVNVKLCEDKNTLTDQSDERISLLTESSDEKSLLFFCGFCGKEFKCCNLNSSYLPSECISVPHNKPQINQPSLLIDENLVYTLSQKGLHKLNVKTNEPLWPHPPQTDLKYLKLIAGKGQNQNKIYSFADKSKNNAGENEEWIPLVFQNCLNDRGGPKTHLHKSWTSTISARLECGKDFTKLIDVFSLETDHDTKIYTLFRNYWNISAVCVYNLTEISNIFSSSENAPGGFNAARCVNDSTTLKLEDLMFMVNHQEIKNTVKPESRPLVFKHRRYTHLQVDRVMDSTILLLALENGGVHKVLEKPHRDPPFIIAEYQPLSQDSNITGIFLDSSEKRVLLSSPSELVQINMDLCDVYGDQCNQCLLSRDPYCHWNSTHCTSDKGNGNQKIHKCGEAAVALPSKTERFSGTPVISIPRFSKHFLVCPITSQHASYHWFHDDRQQECVFSDQSCMFLIESMNKSLEGSYACECTEDSFNSTIIRVELSMSRSSGVRPVVVSYLFLSLTTLHFLL